MNLVDGLLVDFAVVGFDLLFVFCLLVCLGVNDQVLVVIRFDLVLCLLGCAVCGCLA